MPNVLQESAPQGYGTDSYIYGVDNLAQTDGSTTDYFLPDALGSTRQLVNADDQLTLAENYDPFGNTVASMGSDSSIFGFTGQQTDSTGLQYLRARYYDPSVGMFTSRDTWSGDDNDPMSFNHWAYTDDNPVNLSDPSGNSSYSDICFGQVMAQGNLLNMSAQRLISLCYDFWSQSNWSHISIPGGIGPYNCGALSQEKWTKPTSAGELFGDFICNRGQETVTFNGNDILTVKVAWSLVVDKVRKQYYEEGTYPNPMDFGDPGAYIAEWADLLYDPNEFPIAQIIGSFDISIAADGTDRIRFVLSNRTDLASGTHFIGRFPPPDHEYDPYTLEDYIHDHPGEANSSAGQIINTHRDIVAILRPRNS